MELLPLRYFVEIARDGSLSRAAIRLGVSQPALSRQLRKLEGEVRTELFYRHGRGVALTEAGQRLYAVGAEVLERLTGAKEELLASRREVAGTITLGLPPSIASTLGAPLALRFAALFPQARLRIREGFSGVLVEWVENGRLDLAVLYDARRGPTTLVTPLLLEDLFLIEPPGTAGTGPAVLTELRSAVLMLPGPENGLRRVFDAACRKVRVEPRVVMEIDCVAALRQLVEDGRGRTVLPFGAVHREVQDGRLSARPFRHASMKAMLVVATPAHRPVTRLARLVLDLLRAEVRQLVELRTLRGSTRGLSGRGAAPEAGTPSHRPSTAAEEAPDGEFLPVSAPGSRAGSPTRGLREMRSGR
ncbi:LysR substrate-binding domain-containing protein [Muricoccus radiodurans]|uniref:LysR substrate-binding domain-containing protein n=1 Tax=Muricoccus radiodurans TaxID=2231721 RepID=UPI003CEEE2C5